MGRYKQVMNGLVKLFCILFYYGIFIRLKRCYLLFFSKHRQNLDLSNKTVLITGASSGIGLQLAHDLISLPSDHRPKKLILWDLNKNPDFKEKDTVGNVIIECYKVDITDYKTVVELIK